MLDGIFDGISVPCGAACDLHPVDVDVLFDDIESVEGLWAIAVVDSDPRDPVGVAVFDGCVQVVAELEFLFDGYDEGLG